MKTRFSLLWTALMAAATVIAQVHITVADPETWSTKELQPYIGKTVVFDAPIVVTSNSGMQVSTRRLFYPTNQAEPGTKDYKRIDSLNNEGQMSLEGVSGYHRCGEKIYNLTARVNSQKSLSWVSGEWRGNTRADLENANLRQLVDIDQCDNCLLVCAFNLENYYVEHLGNQYMGADSYSEHQKQRTKISKALKKIDADIFGLVEVEQSNAAVQEITDDLNKNLPQREYQFFHDTENSVFQKVEFVYDSKRVRPIGSVRSTSFNTISGDKHKMVCFEELATGERFLFSINHFKAKVGSAAGADADQKDGQGAFNASRTGEAQAIVTLYNRYMSDIREKDVLIMGDLNAYAKEDPIMAFIDNDMIDLHRAFHADSSYSYQHSHRAGYLDHAICNNSLYRQVRGMIAFHINSDENDYYTYDRSNDNTMFRCSDHDPVLVGLQLDSTLSQDIKPIVFGKDFSDTISLLNMYDLNNPDNKSYFAIYNINGLTICPRTEIRYTDEMLQQKNKTYTLSSDNPYLPEEIKQYMPLPSGLYIFHLYFKGQVLHKKVIVK